MDKIKEAEVLDAEYIPLLLQRPKPRTAAPLLAILGGTLALITFGGIIAIAIGTAIIIGITAMILRPLLMLLGVKTPKARRFFGRAVFMHAGHRPGHRHQR